jgi:hypothetical protein
VTRPKRLVSAWVAMTVSPSSAAPWWRVGDELPRRLGQDLGRTGPVNR